MKRQNVTVWKERVPAVTKLESVDVPKSSAPTMILMPKAIGWGGGEMPWKTKVPASSSSKHTFSSSTKKAPQLRGLIVCKG